jgi:hypothetical protein
MEEEERLLLASAAIERLNGGASAVRVTSVARRRGRRGGTRGEE